MAFEDSVSDVLTGIAVAAFLVSIVLGTLYRVFGGKFFIPKREVILPNQAGVLVKDDRVVRVLGPGSCWIRPKQRLVLCDMRPRSLRLVAKEVLGSDFGIIRISLNGSYKVADPASYYIASTNVADEIHIQLQRVITTSARLLPVGSIVNDADMFAALVRDQLAPAATQLGLEITEMKIWECVAMGFIRQEQTESAPVSDLPGGLIH